MLSVRFGLALPGKQALLRLLLLLQLLLTPKLTPLTPRQPLRRGIGLRHRLVLGRLHRIFPIDRLRAGLGCGLG